MNTFTQAKQIANFIYDIAVPFMLLAVVAFIGQGYYAHWQQEEANAAKLPHSLYMETNVSDQLQMGTAPITSDYNPQWTAYDTDIQPTLQTPQLQGWATKDY